MRRSLPVIVSGLLLGLFGVLGAGLVGLSHQGTAERIARNEREALLEQLERLVPADQIDNDMLGDAIEVAAPEELGAATTRVYRGRRGSRPVAAVLSPVVTQGYSGPIQLIVAVRADGTLSGVRVLGHRETPGLGDKIAFDPEFKANFEALAVKPRIVAIKDGKTEPNQVDCITGATISSEAVVTILNRSTERWIPLVETLLDSREGGPHAARRDP